MVDEVGVSLELFLGADEFEDFFLFVGDVIVRGGGLELVQLSASLQDREYVLRDDARVSAGGEEEGGEVGEVEG